MQLQLITPEEILFEGEAQMVTMPGEEGEFGVLSGHAPVISTLKAGVITIDFANKDKRRMAILSGLAEVTPDRCVVLAEKAEDCTQTTPAQAQAKLDAAHAAMNDANTDEEKKSAAQVLAIAKAIAHSL